MGYIGTLGHSTYRCNVFKFPPPLPNSPPPREFENVLKFPPRNLKTFSDSRGEFKNRFQIPPPFSNSPLQEFENVFKLTRGKLKTFSNSRGKGICMGAGEI